MRNMLPGIAPSCSFLYRTSCSTEPCGGVMSRQIKYSNLYSLINEEKVVFQTPTRPKIVLEFSQDTSLLCPVLQLTSEYVTK